MLKKSSYILEIDYRSVTPVKQETGRKPKLNFLEKWNKQSRNKINWKSGRTRRTLTVQATPGNILPKWE